MRHRAGLRFNEMVASGELSAPVIIGRDHLDCGSVASPYRAVLTNDPAMGVIRHVDAGYDRAAEVAAERGAWCRWSRG